MKKMFSIVLVFISVISLFGCVVDEKEYQVTLELDGGIGQEVYVVNHGEKLQISDVSKEGYFLEGWYLEDTFTTKYDFDYEVDKDFTLYAKWTIVTNSEKNTISLELNGGIGETSIISLSGETIVAPTNPTKEGYSFNGWYSDSSFTTLYTFGIMPNEDITLYAKWDVIVYTLDLVANISEATPTKVIGDVVQSKQTYTVTAPYVTGYSFKEWRVQGTTTTLSVNPVFVYAISENTILEAVYEVQGTTQEPTLFYETNFDDGDKGSYAIGDISLNGEMWTLSDALVGSLATDLKVSGKSVRIRDGYIQTKFAVTDLAQVVFQVGTYGSDDNTEVQFQVSSDGVTWVTVDSFTTTNALEEKSYVFDSSLYNTLGVSEDASLYLKIVSSTTERTNVDDFKIYTGEGSIANDTPLYVITFTDNMVYTYFVNDTVDLDECIATHPITGATTCDISGSVDSSIAGIYEVTYSKTDEFGNTVRETVTITIVDENNADYLNMDLATYYDNAEGLYGNDLITALHLILNTGFNGVTYGEVRYILDETDQDPNNPNNLILLYLGTSTDGDWDSGVDWNREHIWPQSLLGEDADNGIVNSASDLFNLMPADPGINSSRGNSPYSEMGLGFEPRDEVKGDIARALFYMMIMYDELDLVNRAPGVHEMGYLDELLQWHFEDPVDSFELARLEVIYSYQGNRNPFVDYPHLVNLIWFYNPSSGE